MNILKLLLTVLFLMSCSSVDESGAEKKQSMEDRSQYEQQQQIRNQFPGGRGY